MASVPMSELSDLRAQTKLLARKESEVVRLEESEKSLKDAINKLREGKVSVFSYRHCDARANRNYTQCTDQNN